MSGKHEAPGTKHQWPAAGRWMSPKEAAERISGRTEWEPLPLTKSPTQSWLTPPM